MPNLPKVKVGNVVLCEHVIQGSGNKHTLINVYSGDVLVSELPATLFFGIYIEHYASSPSGLAMVDICLDSKKYAEIGVQFQKDENGGIGIIAIPVFQLTLTKEVDLSLILKESGRRDTCVIKKKIILTDHDGLSIA